MSIRMRGGQWQADVRVAATANPTGREVRIRLGAPTRDAALALEATARLSITETGSYTPGAKPKANAKGTLEAALRLAWSSNAGRKGGWNKQANGAGQLRNAEMCVEFFGKNRLCASIDSKAMDELVSHFRDLGNANDTIRLKCQAFYRILDYAVREKWMLARPKWERPAPGIPREFVFTPELEAALISFFRDVRKEPDLADLIEVAVETGGRLMELITSRDYEWQLDRQLWLVPGSRTKTGKSRNVTLSDRAIAIMRRRCAGLEPDACPFPQWGHKVISERFMTAREFLGFKHNKDFVFHALRHTRATRLAELTQNPFVVMSQLGHTVVATSMRYIKMAKIDLRSEAWRNWQTRAA